MTSIPPNTPLPDTPVTTVDVKPSQTPTSQAAASSTVQATTDVGIAVVSKPSVPVKPQIPLRERKVKPFSLAKLWERFCRIFKNLFNSSDTTISTSLAPFVTEVVPLKRFDAFDLWPQKPVVQTGQASGLQKSNLPPRAVETPAKVRNELPAKLDDLAKALNRAKATANTAGIQVPKPQANITGSNCYMNSSLQTLENCYLQHDVNLQNLVDQDFTMRPNETLKAFEKRVLHTWAPITDLEDVNVAQLEEEIRNLEAALCQLGADQPVEKRRINERIAVCKETIRQVNNQDTANHNDRVQFKLSYLLVLQAKKYGSPSQVTDALKIHHSAAFMLNAPYMQFHERRDQLDASFYLFLWHDTLGLGIYQSSFREAVLPDGGIYKSPNAVVEKSPLIKINLRNDQGVNVKSLTESIERYFSDSIKNGVNKAKLLETLNSKRSALEKISVINVLGRNNLEREIAEIHNQYIKIAGGEFTRPNGTKGVYDPEVWKAEDDLTFDDWTKNKSIIDRPPQFLQIALDRFYSNQDQSRQFKIAEKIPFDTDADNKPTGSFTDPIDLGKYFSNQENDARYELIGIVQHQGSSINGGHYVSYVKRGDQWYYTSDSTVRACKITDVPFDNCSVLSYRRL